MTETHLIDETGRTVFRGTQSPGGGSQPLDVVRFPFAFDTPGIGPTIFPLTAVDVDLQTFTVAGDHAASFPAGSAVIVQGLPAATYTSTGAVFAGGSTTISTLEPPSDPTPDGFIYDNAQGLVVYTPTPGDAIIGGYLSIPTPWDGDNPNLHLQTEGDALNGAFLDAFSLTAEDGSGYVTKTPAVPDVLAESSSIPVPSLLPTAAPLRAAIDNEAGVDPGSDQGEAELVLWIVKAT